jgi:hypothetical protein
VWALASSTVVDQGEGMAQMAEHLPSQAQGPGFTLQHCKEKSNYKKVPNFFCCSIKILHINISLNVNDNSLFVLIA